MVEAFNRRDRQAFLALMHDDAEIVPLRAALEGTVYRGPGAAARFWDEGDAAWESLRLELELSQVGERVLGLGWLRASGRTTGAPVETPLGLVAELRDGRIAAGRAYTDLDEARAAAGRQR